MIKFIRFFICTFVTFTFISLPVMQLVAKECPSSNPALGPAALSGTYIIDPSGAGDFKTFNAAAISLATNGITGPVKIRVKAGTYNEQVSVTHIPGTSATNTVTFESFNLDSNSVILTYAPTDVNYIWVLALNGAKHITFRKMTIKATGTVCGVAVNIFGGSDSNTICNNVLSVPVTGNGSFEVVVFDDSKFSMTTTDNYNLVRNNLVTGGYMGIDCNATSSIDAGKGNVIDGNSVKAFYNVGINCRYQNHLSVSNNYIEATSGTMTIYGIELNYVLHMDVTKNRLKLSSSNTVRSLYSGNSEYGTFSNNRIEVSGNVSITGFEDYYNLNIIFNANYINLSSSSSNNVYGIQSTANNSGDTSARSKFYNNFISCSTASNASAIPAYFTNGSSVEIMNNSLNTITSLTTGTVMYLNSTNKTLAYTIKNNIISNFAGGYTLYCPGSTVLIASDHNDLYTTGGNIAYWHGNSYPSLANYQSASGQDIHSISVAPGYYSMTDLHVNTNALNNLAVPISYITTDYDGDPRSATTPDLGADEFDPVNNDAGVSDFVSPLSPCLGTNSISVKIENYGLTTLSSVKCNWSVNGVLQSPSTFTVSLAQYKNIIETLGTYSFSAGTKYVFKFWTTLPNGSSDQNYRNDTFYYTINNTALNGTYTIGASGSDYTTLNAAVNDLISRGICSAVKFRIKAGSYNENTVIPAITGASAAHTITFESFDLDSNAVDINYTAAGTNDNYVIRLSNSSYITFNKLKLRALSATNNVVISLTGNSSYNNFTNNILASIVSTQTSNNGVIYKDASGTSSYNTIKNNLISGGYSGIYLYATTYANRDLNNIVQNNRIIDFFTMGLYLSYQASILVIGNYIENSGNSNNTVYGAYTTNAYDSAKIVGNKIVVHGTSSNYGIYKTNSNYNHAGSYGLVANNFVTVSGASLSANFGIYDYYSTNQYIYNNSVNVETKSATGSAFYVSGTSNIYILNNIFVNTGGGFAYYANSTTGIVNTNYNDLYEKGGSYLGYWSGTSCINLVSWKAAATKETKSISADPLFKSSTDLHVSSKALDSAGTPVTQVIDDIDGDKRNATKPDIGADEFRVWNYDASVIALTSFNSPCPGTPSSVVVRLRNMGISTINTTKVKWVINGVPCKTLNFSGNLAGSKDTLLVLGNYTFLKGTSYFIKIWADTLNGFPDQLPKNDTLKIFNLHTSLSGTYTIGLSGKDYKSFTDAAFDLVNYGLCGAVTFLADPGVYNEHFILNAIPGASVSKTLTFRSANNDSTSVILCWAATSNLDNYVIGLNGTNWLRFEKMTIRSISSTTYGNVIYMANSASNNIIRNCILQSNKTTGNNYVIYLQQSNLPCNYNLFENNILQYGMYSVFLYGYSSSNTEHGNMVRNNRISEYTGSGIYGYYQDSVEISGNRISSTGSSTIYGIYLGNESNSFHVTNNQIYVKSTAGAYGLYLDRCAAKATANAMIVNNFISIFGSTSSNTVEGIYDYNCSYQKIYHNSISISCGSSINSYCMYLDCNNPPANYGKIDVQNNILNNTGGGYAYYVGTTATTSYLSSANYNDVYFTGSFLGRWGTKDITDLASWRTTTGKELKSFAYAPPFISDSNLHLSLFVPLSVTNYVGITTDIDGDTRSTKLPVVGADELPVIQFDAGILGIPNPVKYACEGIFPVSANLINYGSNDLDSVLVDYIVNGKIKRTIKWNGSLGYFNSTTISFGTDTFKSTGKIIKIKIRTRLPNGKTDLHLYNDADSSDLHIFAFPVISSTKSDTGCKGGFAELMAHSQNSQNFEWWDSLTGGTLLSTDSVFNVSPLSATRTYYVNSATPGSPSSLKTSTFQSGLEMGNMFDVKALSSDLVIDSFAVHSTSLSMGFAFPVAVYYKKGTYVGSETNPSPWTLLGIDTVVSNGSGKYTNVNVGSVKLKKGVAYGFYISSTDPSMLLNYTDGNLTYSDPYLQITTGTKTFYPFDAYWVKNKTWNGMIYYETTPMCRSLRVPVVVLVKPSFAPAPKLGKDTAFCKGGSLLLNAGSGSGYSYDWKYGTATKTISTSQTIKVDSAGMYRVIVSSSGCKGTDTLNLGIYQLPHVTYSVNYIGHCLLHNSFVFTDYSTVSGDKISAWHWDFGDGVTAAIAKPAHSYLTEGYFPVRLVAFSSQGCLDSFTGDVTVYPQPKAGFKINDSSQCLSGNNFIFTNSSSVKTGVLVYYWTLGDGTNKSTTHCTHSYTKIGAYPVLLVATSDYSCIDSIVHFVWVGTNITVNIGKDTTLTDKQSIKLDAGSGFAHYSWSTGDTTQTITIDSNGSGHKTKIIWVTVTKSGCKGSDTIIISFKVGISMQSGLLKFMLYPNPAQTYLNIETENLQKKTTLMLSDARGNAIRTLELEPQTGKTLKTIDISSIAKGIYFIRLVSDYGTETRMMVKE